MMRDLPSRLGRLEHRLPADDTIFSGEEFRTLLSRLPTGVVRQVYLDYIAHKIGWEGVVDALLSAAAERGDPASPPSTRPPK